MSTEPQFRIAVVSHTHPSISKGGAEISAYTLFKGLRAIGQDAIFIAACAHKDRARLVLGSDHERAVFYDPSLYDHFYHIASPAVLKDLRGILEEERISLVNFHHYLNFGVGSIRSLATDKAMKTVVTLHEFLSICHHHGQMITRPLHTLCNRPSPQACSTCFPEIAHTQFALRRSNFLDAYSEVDGFISPSHFLASRFADWGIPADRLAVIENGLAHLPSADQRKIRPSGDAMVFGFFGQINPFKGVDLLLDAAEIIGEMPDLARKIRIRIHGNLIGVSEMFSKRFEAAVKKYPFLSYMGPYDNSNVAHLMSDCHYVLVPSKWWENSPVVIQEAYAIGRPVICTGIGGMAEKVQDGVSGLHFRLNDAGDLVRALTEASDPQKYVDLRSGLPEISDGTSMATDYLGAFRQFTKDTGKVAEPLLMNAAE